MRLVSPVSLLAGDRESPEGQVFDRHDARFWVSANRGAIAGVTPDGATELVNAGGVPAGLAFHPNGTLSGADSDPDRHGVVTVAPDGASAVVDVAHDAAGQIDPTDAIPVSGARPSDVAFRLRSPDPGRRRERHPLRRSGRGRRTTDDPLSGDAPDHIGARIGGRAPLLGVEGGNG